MRYEWSLTGDVSCGVLVLRGLVVGAGVLVGHAVLELVGLGRLVLLLLVDRLVHRLGDVLGLRGAVGGGRRRVRVGLVVGVRVGEGGAHNGEKDEALKIRRERLSYRRLGEKPSRLALSLRAYIRTFIVFCRISY